LASAARPHDLHRPDIGPVWVLAHSAHSTIQWNVHEQANRNIDLYAAGLQSDS
jgi:hypothetical protein